MKPYPLFVPIGIKIRTTTLSSIVAWITDVNIQRVVFLLGFSVAFASFYIQYLLAYCSKCRPLSIFVHASWWLPTALDAS